MTDTYRTLCAELLDELEYQTDWSIAEELKQRARTELSQTPFEDKMEKNSSNSLPKNYIDPEHCGEDRNLLETFYTACKSEGGTSDEITLRGLRAVLSKWGCLTLPAEGEMTDEELLRAYGKARRDYCYDGPIDDWPKRAERSATIAGLRAVEASVIARRPAPAPQVEGEVAELVSAVHAAYAAYGWVEEKQFIRFFDEVSRLASVIEEGCDCSVDGPINWQAEIELMCQRLKPVPVSERLPEPKNCIPHPRTQRGNWCWGFERCDVSLARPARWRLMHMETIEMEASHWISGQDLPIPSVEVEE